jgi:hypothetical protein
MRGKQSTNEPRNENSRTRTATVLAGNKKTQSGSTIPGPSLIAQTTGRIRQERWGIRQGSAADRRKRFRRTMPIAILGAAYFDGSLRPRS